MTTELRALGREGRSGAEEEAVAVGADEEFVVADMVVGAAGLAADEAANEVPISHSNQYTRTKIGNRRKTWWSNTYHRPKRQPSPTVWVAIPTPWQCGRGFLTSVAWESTRTKEPAKEAESRDG